MFISIGVTMKSIDINQALPKISELLDMAFSAEEIIITNQNQQKIRISAISVNSQRPPLFGSDRDRIFIADDFDAPLDDFQDYM